MSKIKEKGRDIFGRVTSTLESGADRAQSELGKLQSQAAGAPDASRVHIWARIGEARGKQDAEQEKLRSSLATQIADASAQVGELEAAAAGLAGEARDKVLHDAEELRAGRERARQKLVTNLQAEVAEAEHEIAALQREAADAPADATSRIMARVACAGSRRDVAREWLNAIQTPAEAEQARQG